MSASSASEAQGRTPWPGAAGSTWRATRGKAPPPAPANSGAYASQRSAARGPVARRTRCVVGTHTCVNAHSTHSRTTGRGQAPCAPGSGHTARPCLIARARLAKRAIADHAVDCGGRGAVRAPRGLVVRRDAERTVAREHRQSAGRARRDANLRSGHPTVRTSGLFGVFREARAQWLRASAYQSRVGPRGARRHGHGTEAFMRSGVDTVRAGGDWASSCGVIRISPTETCGAAAGYGGAGRRRHERSRGGACRRAAPHPKRSLQ